MPRSAPKPCKHTGCKEVTHNTDSYCDEHTPAHTHNWVSDKIRGNRHHRGYGTKWDKTRPIIIKRDYGLCQTCIRAGRTTSAKIVDHIISKENGGSDEHSNLELICKPCHDIKTRREQSNG